MTDPAARARAIIDANQYMTLATVDEDGRPWASPVWFAHEDHRRFLWVSKPEARHSRNLAVRPLAGLVVFDSTVRMGTGEAVYAEASAEELGGGEAERSIATFSRRSRELGGREWTAADVSPSARLRLYRATAAELFILGENDERIAVELG
jgi:nitroimidazol reductase NimA-like FMN-containing flavoprotein (pyridoxamine 5'-phosphate oxidase superfamily)